MTSATRHPAHPVLGGQSPMRLEPLGSLRRRKRAQHGVSSMSGVSRVVRLLAGVGSRLPSALLVSRGLRCVRSYQGDSAASVRSTRSPNASECSVETKTIGSSSTPRYTPAHHESDSPYLRQIGRLRPTLP